VPAEYRRSVRGSDADAAGNVIRRNNAQQSATMHGNAYALMFPPLMPTVSLIDKCCRDRNESE
jgi:hypothetical protein